MGMPTTRMHRPWRMLVALLGTGWLIGEAAGADSTVVIVGWDGGKPSVMQRLLDQGRLPHLRALMAEGRYTWQAQTVIPSTTLPSFTSMLTGVVPSRHGVLWNDYEPDRGWVSVPTVFDRVRQADGAGFGPTAMVFAKEKFRHLVKPGSPDVAEMVDGEAPEVAATAVRLIHGLRPRLLFVHFRDPDSAGHRYGWGDDTRGQPPSPQFQEALQRCDRALGTIVEALRQTGLWPETLLIVTADHGGHGTTHGTADPQDVHIPWVAAGGIVSPGGPLPRPVRTVDTAATALAALGLTPPADWDGRPVWDVLRPRQDRPSQQPRRPPVHAPPMAYRNVPGLNSYSRPGTTGTSIRGWSLK